MSEKIALLTLRLTLTAFFLVWATEKFVKPETTAAIFARFYGIDGLPAGASYAAGAVQLFLIAGFAVVGRLRWFFVGALMLMHGFVTATTWDILINPYEGSHHLFWAGVPTLCGLIALFILREKDTLLTFGR